LQYMRRNSSNAQGIAPDSPAMVSWEKRDYMAPVK
jgi:hypothetical protein